MSGLSAINSKLRYLESVSVEKARGRQVSVVHYDPESGVVGWPEVINQRGGCLLVGRPFEQSLKGESEWLAWVEKYGQQGA